MDISSVVTQLRQELERIENAIAALVGLRQNLALSTVNMLFHRSASADDPASSHGEA